VSFSMETKDELARIFPEKHCCQIAELAALTRLDGTMFIDEKQQVSLVIATESSPVARKIFRLFKDLYNVEPKIRIQRKKRFNKNILYGVRLNSFPEINKVLKELGILGRDGDVLPGIKKNLIRTKCCRRSYLRGVFLAAGSVNSPESNYHLEIITNNKRYAQALVKVMSHFPELLAKISPRKNRYIVYLKESEQIAAFLNIIGAHRALLEFENVRIMKDMRNKVNRLVNCDTANLKKAVNASLRQIKQIKLIDQTIGLEKLPLRLREIARLRLEHPDSSLRELGERLDPPVGKSGVNHRFRKIEAIAEKINLEIPESDKKI
jgi:DNA-binding protein WhiA